MNIEHDQRPDQLIARFNKLGRAADYLNRYLQAAGTEAGPQAINITNIESEDPNQIVPKILRFGRAKSNAINLLKQINLWQSELGPLVKLFNDSQELESMKDQLPESAFNLAKQKIDASIMALMDGVVPVVAKPELPAAPASVNPAVALTRHLSRGAEVSSAAEADIKPVQVLFSEQGVIIHGQQTGLSPAYLEVLKTLVENPNKWMTAKQISQMAFNEPNTKVTDINHRFKALAQIINQSAGIELLRINHYGNSTQYQARGLEFAGVEADKTKLDLAGLPGKIIIKLWPFSFEHRVMYDQLVAFTREGRVDDESREWGRRSLSDAKRRLRDSGLELVKLGRNGPYFVRKTERQEVVVNPLTDEVAAVLANLLLARDNTEIRFRDGSQYNFSLDDLDVRVSLENLRMRLFEETGEHRALTPKEVEQLKPLCLQVVEQIIQSDKSTLGRFYEFAETYINGGGQVRHKMDDNKFCLTYFLRNTQVLSGETFVRFLQDSIERDITIEPITKRGAYMVRGVQKYWQAPKSQ